MLLLYKSEIFSVITRYEPYEYLDEEFFATGMKGYLAYQFIDLNGLQNYSKRKYSVYFSFQLLYPIIQKVLHRKLNERLKEIEAELEYKKVDIR